jgi:hypothetical protein
MTQEEQDYTNEEYLSDILSSVKPASAPKLLRQRVGKNELISLVAKDCRYPKHEVEDVLKGLWNVVNVNLERGREFDFGGMFTARLYKPHPRRIYDFKLEGFRITDPRPRLKLVSTDMYQRYLWKGIHAPVNYFAPKNLRNQFQSPEEFTEEYNNAYQQWLEEDNRRKLKKEQENEITT